MRLLPLLIAVALINRSPARAHAQGTRPFSVEDLFAIETLSDVRLSPDGALIAVVIQRAWSDPEVYRPYPMFGNDHADVWILPATGGPPRNITQGSKDTSGYWSPVWSPDGERLALLSTAGRDNVRAYVWERRSGRLVRLADRGVELLTATNAAGEPTPFHWIDATRLLVTLLPAGEQPLAFRSRRQTPRIASEAWAKAAQGREPTSSVLEGGITAGRDRASQLVLIDAATQRTRVLAEGGIRFVLPSPDGRHVAVFAQSRRPQPGHGQLLGAADSAPSRLGIVALEGEPAVRWVAEVLNPVVSFGPKPHRWSPRGSTLAVLGSARGETSMPGAVFLVSPKDLSVRRAAENLRVSALAWTEREQLLVRASTPGQDGRADWWSIPPPPGTPRNLTGAQTVAPAELVRTRAPDEMVGLAGGAMWSLNVSSGAHRRLTDPGRYSVTGFAWPTAAGRATTALASAIVRIRAGSSDSLVRLDLPGGGMSSFPRPAKATAVAAYHPEQNLAVFTAPQDPDGTFLWTGAGRKDGFAERIALNRQLAAISGGELQLIDYRSLDGRDLKGILILPAGYRTGTRYPLVTWVYPGFVIRDIASQAFWVIKNQAHQDNLHVLAGHGYAVLVPSLPTSVNLNERELAGLTNGVLPAIDRVVELGLADPDRVAVAGQSGGGYVTYGLITQTHRFKAAVAISGPANHLTSYGIFSGETRYSDDIEEIIRGSQGRFGSPPWADPDPYIQNSPTRFLDRVETPLLIIHGDIDYVPIQHAEEVFAGLARLGKRVRFVRYWGESHGAADSPANLRDRWRHILSWLDTYLQ